MKTSQSQKTSIIAAWVFILLASLLPKVLLQEIFHQTVSANLQSVISASAIIMGLLLSVVWEPLHRLRSFLVLFLVLELEACMDRVSGYILMLKGPRINNSALPVNPY